MLARRLSNQQITRPALATPAELVAWLGAVQAQDYAAVKWALGLRLRDAAASDTTIERAVADGSILRTHALRGTWQFVAPADVRWMLALGAPRVRARLTTRHRELGLDAATFRRGKTVLARALRGGDPLTRDELAAALEDAGVSTIGQRFAHLLGAAELDGLICGGARRGKQFTYTLLDAIAPPSRAGLERDEALAELTGRYFRSRGPATVQDFAWWSGLGPSDARAGLSMIHATLASEVIDGRTYWRAADSLAGAAPPAAILLPAFDEYLVAYRDRDAVLEPKHVERVNAGGGMLKPCVVVRGRVVGVWRRVLNRTSVSIELDLFRPLDRVEQRAVGAAAGRYAGFLGLSAELSRTNIMM
jgi:hypothetical protein